MRVRITDGTREVELASRRATLPELEATALRLLAAIPPVGDDNTPTPDDDTPHPHPAPLGFTLDGVSLSSDTERAEPYVEPGREHDDDEWRHQR
ncbi:hypothetical protein AB4225_06150 [Streptomyces sp. 2RAF24]|uniref:hypothetical protein n=1 Tax=Streptomyces sp. 2RAF24 TaxID=3232997 RepID=UPI003F95DC2A